MSATIIVGTQWGDEGKGKIVDLLAPDYDYIVRYQGGPNAGHTIHRGGKDIILHQVPSGIMHPHTKNMIGNGMVLNLEELLQEMDILRTLDVTFIDRFYISDRAHIILPSHISQDHATEKERIGTTGRGIGPAYTAKVSRTGMRMCDLLASKDAAFAQARKQLAPYITNTALLLGNALRHKKNILLEGAQGTFLDVDHGTYPFVTSSSATAGGACTGSGIGPTAITRVTGIMKAYTTRVGNGPFLTELGGARAAEYCKEGDAHGAQYEQETFPSAAELFTEDSFSFGIGLRKKGGEYGATTKRPRRTGWLDLPMIHYAINVNGISDIALTKLDVLGDLPYIDLCTNYLLEGISIPYPTDPAVLARVIPHYERFPGWEGSLSHIRHYSDLPKTAKEYITFIETLLDTPIRIISVGPEKDQTIQKKTMAKK